MKMIALSLFSMLLISCISQEKKAITNKISDALKAKSESQIGEYITKVFEDSKRNLWFGTLQKGMAKYDGNTLKYFSKNDGLPSERVTGIIEDSTGIFWLMTGAGISKFDGKNFTNISVNKNFASNMISTLMFDSKGLLWVGTWGGVYKYDGKEFISFPVPKPQVTTLINKDTEDWITEIEEDADGNIWIGRDGYGACKYDGASFTHFLKKDGLHSNNVTEIEIDGDGSIWFGTRVAEQDNPNPKKRIGKGGLNKLTNDGIISFPEIEAFNNGDVYEIYNDHSGDLWICTTKNGVYRFDGRAFNHYEVPISIMSISKDHKENLWLGGAGGLYRINKNEEILNITKNGPWE